MHERLAHIDALRGRVEAARSHLSGCAAWATSDDLQFRIAYSALEAALALAEGSHQVAIAASQRAMEVTIEGGFAVCLDGTRTAFAVGLEAAFAASDLEAAAALIEPIATRPVGEVPPFLRAQIRRYEAARSAAAGQHGDAESSLVAAEATLRELGYIYWTARIQLDRAELLADQQRHGEAARLAREAAATFEIVGAAPLLGRARALLEPEIPASDLVDERALVQSRAAPFE